MGTWRYTPFCIGIKYRLLSLNTTFQLQFSVYFPFPTQLSVRTFWCIQKGGQNWILKGELCCKLFSISNKNSCQECRRDAEVTYLLMYSPVRTLPQALHLKLPRCHCLSRASNACPFFMSLPQPAQSANKQTNAFVVSSLVH